MAEILGAVASSVQLADVALRASRELYGFLSAIKNANEDIKVLRTVLRDVEANVRSLRRYTIDFQKSKYAVEEFEVLSEAITGSFTGFHDDILALKTVLPSKPSADLAERVGWVWQKQRVKDVTTRLNNRNLNLCTALSIAGRRHELRSREETSKLKDEQSKFKHATTLQLNTLNQKVESQSTDTVKLLEYDRQIIRSIETAQISTSSDHEAFASGLARQSQLIRRGHDEFQRQGVNLLTASHRTHETMKQFQSRTEKDFRKSRRSLNRLQNTVEELASKATFSAVTVEAATRIIREELRVNLRDILDQERENSQNVFEAKLRKMEAMVDQISLDIGHDFSLAREEHVMDKSLDITPANQSMIAQERGSFDFRDTEYFPDVFDQSLSIEPDIVTSTYRRTWDKDWKLGHVHIEIIHITIRKGGSPHAKTHYTLKIEFRPTASLSTIPGTSLLCSTAPTRQGHYQMAPMIALLPMIHDMDNLISIVFEGDLPELKRMLASGYVHIRSQYEFGETLLYVAAAFHQYEICTFLLGQGLCWNDKTIGQVIDRVNPVRNLTSFRSIETPLHATLPLFFGLYKKTDIRIVKALCAPEGNIETIWREFMTSGFDFHSFFFGQTHVEPKILSSLFEGIRYITSHSAGGWEICCAGLQRYWARPSALGLYLIGALLDEGLNPNLRIATLRRPTQDRLHPLLVYALEGVSHYKAKNYTIGQVDSLTASKPELSEEEEFPRPWCILVCLIRSGADIYYIFEDSFDHASSWYDLESLGVFSVTWDSATEWDRAVLEAGFDLDQYLSDDRQSRKQSFRLRGATRSGIDERVLNLPSTAGLKCRRCRAKYCFKHGRNVFEENM